MTDIKVTLGDMLEVLAARKGPLFDAVVTDPPYHLQSIVKRFGGKNAAPAKEGATGAYARASRGFMSQTWDGGDIAFRPETWRAVYDQMKPGAHLVAFSGTRTYHRMAVAIEDAGFEIRDMLAWTYGSGFPKSHDVAKGIAKRRVEDVEPVRVICRFLRASMDDKGLKSRDLTHVFDDCNARLIDHWAARDTDSQPALPTPFQWKLLVAYLCLYERSGFAAINAEVDRLNGRKGTRGAKWTDAEIVGEVASSAAGFGDLRFDGDRSIRDLDAESAEWTGWGSALKPALEPICLARKPLDGTIAENVLKWGTGGLNIDGCRVGDDLRINPPGSTNDRIAMGNGWRENALPPTAVGRFPANLLHDGSDEVVAGFPETSDGNMPAKRSGLGFGSTSQGTEGQSERLLGGSSSRYFYSAKAGPLDRLGSEHATVKPVDLMRWLCRLVTPKGGLILEPFGGSGTTAIAAMAEGFNCELIELMPEHVADIETKIAYLRGEGGRIMERHLKRKAKRAKPTEAGLFGDGL